MSKEKAKYIATYITEQLNRKRDETIFDDSLDEYIEAISAEMILNANEAYEAGAR